SIGGEDLAGIPVELGAVEHLIGPLTLKVPRQDDGQKTLAAGLVVQGLLGFDLQDGMESELVEGEFRPGLFDVGRPCGHARQTRTLLARGPFAFSRGWRWRGVEGTFGMDMADEVDVGREVRQDALAAVST